MFTKIKVICIVLCGLHHIHGGAMGTALTCSPDTSTTGAQSVAERNIFTASSLATAIRFALIEVAQFLLANPNTPIYDEQENSDNLLAAMKGGLEQIDPSKDKKMIRMLLYFGFNPTSKKPESKLLTVQETAYAFSSIDTDYSKWMDNYKNIEKYCSPQELVEFGRIKRARLGITHDYLIRREIGGLQVKKMSAQKISAPTAAASNQTAAAPSAKDSKESSK